MKSALHLTPTGTRPPPPKTHGSYPGDEVARRLGQGSQSTVKWGDLRTRWVHRQFVRWHQRRMSCKQPDLSDVYTDVKTAAPNAPPTCIVALTKALAAPASRSGTPTDESHDLLRNDQQTADRTSGGLETKSRKQSRRHTFRDEDATDDGHGCETGNNGAAPENDLEVES